MSVKGNISVKQSNITVDLDLLNSKVDKIAGKGLSTNDYTDDDKTKLFDIEQNANKYIHPGTHSTDIIITPDEKTATEKFVLLDNVIGSGRTTETIKVNADNIVTLNNNLDNLAGQDRTIETVKANADEIVTLKEDYTSQRQQDNLKVATVEKELNDYKSTMANVNVNQEAKQKVTGYGTISLPKNTANGQVSVSVKGRTLKNELNYNRDTWAEWIKSAGVIGGSTGLEFTFSDTAIVYSSLPVKLKPSTNYGILVFCVTNTLISKSLFVENSLTGTAFEFIAAGKTGNIKTAFLTKGDLVSPINFSLRRSFNGDGGLKIKIKDIRMFELDTPEKISDFNTLTADQLAQKYPYISGDSAKSTVSASRLKSVGKNLFDVENHVFLEGYIIDKATNSFRTYRNGDIEFGEKYYFQLKPNTKYTLKFNRTIGGNATGSYPVLFNTLGSVLVAPLNSTTIITTPSHGGVYIDFNRLGGGNDKLGWADYSNIQLEEGTIATPYEPYTKSTSYLSNVGELRSLPNGTKDEIRVSGGKAENIQRNNKKILQASDIVRSNNANVNFDIVRITKPLDYIGYNKWHGANRDVVLGGQYSNNKEWNGIDDSASFIGSLYVGTNLTEIWYAVAKGTYADLASAKTALAGLELTYQLAEPIVTPIQVSGNIVSNPSGTIYIDPVTTVAGIYTANGIDVTHEDLPIRAIEKISKVDFTTGIETELDVSKATIAENKLSFTHEDLSLNDIVFFEYEYDVETTQAETTVEYYDSRYTIKDSETDKLYKWNVTVANGTPSISVVEV